MLHLDSLFNTDIMDGYVSMERPFTAQDAEEMFSENVMLKFDIIENQSNILIANVDRLSDMYEYVCTFGVDEKFARMHNCKGMLSDLTHGIIPSCEAWNEHDVTKYTKACMESFLGKIGEAIRWVITKIKDIFNWIFTQLIKFINWVFGLTPQIDKKCEQINKEAAAIDAGKPIETLENSSPKETPDKNANSSEWADGNPGTSDGGHSENSNEVVVTGADMKAAGILVDQLDRIAEKTYITVDDIYDQAKQRYQVIKALGANSVEINAFLTEKHIHRDERHPGAPQGVNAYRTETDFKEGVKDTNKNIEDLYEKLIDEFKNDDEIFKKLDKDLKGIQDKKTLKLIKGYVKNGTGDQVKAVEYVNSVIKAILDRLKDKMKNTRNRIKEIEKELNTIQNNIACRKVKPDSVNAISTQLKRELELHKKIAKRLNCISYSCAYHERINKKTLNDLHDAMVSLNQVNKFRNKKQ